jgi:hypothetical protein
MSVPPDKILQRNESSLSNTAGQSRPKGTPERERETPECYSEKTAQIAEMESKFGIF